MRRVILPLLAALLAAGCTPSVLRPGPSPVPGTASPGASPRPSIFTPSPVTTQGPPSAGFGDVGGGAGSQPSQAMEPKSGSIPCGAVHHGATGKVRVSTKFNCYDVHGSDAAEVQAQMNKRGPVVKGSRADAATEWRIQWSFVTSTRGQACTIDPLSVSLRIVFTFPRWDEPATASSSFRSMWFAFLGRLRAHEFHHKKIAVQTATRVEHALGKVGIYPTCPRAENAGNAAGRRVVAEGRNRQEAFDARQSTAGAA